MKSTTKTHILCVLLGVLCLTVCLTLGVSLSSTILATILGLYLPSFLDGSENTPEGRWWPEFCKLKFWKKVGDYFPMSFRFQEPLDPKKQVIFAAFPHGVASMHHVAVVADVCGWYSDGIHQNEKRDLGASSVFKIPIYREFLLWLGIVDASRRNACDVLRKGKSLYIIPGGETEQILAVYDRHRVFTERKGFVRLAVEFGTDLVPIYSFGEERLYFTSSALQDFRMWISKKYYVALPIAYTMAYGFIPVPFPLCFPNKVPITVCFGAPIKVKKMSPKDEGFAQYVDEVHQIFVEKLKEVFELNKSKCGYKDAVLEFVKG